MKNEIEPVTKEPLNAHTPASALASRVTPTGAFYVRNHFATPRIDPAAWRLRLPGREASLADLRAMPQRSLEVVLECAGNGRTRMRPLPPGTPWGERAVACAAFTGVPLRDLMERPTGAVELLFVGADQGEAHGHHMAYERSLPVERALHPDTLVAIAMNGEPLTAEHGAPARLLVPGWYGMASVKWLTDVKALSKPFAGFYQKDHYVFRGQGDGLDDAPVTLMRVKSIFTSPLEGARLPLGRPARVAGHAWSGAAPIERVDLSDDGGRTWRPTRLDKPGSPYAWTPWHVDWIPAQAGRTTLLARATDAAGNAQPLEAPSNALGYGNNEVARVAVDVG
jgi:DMSO/TMAO reductase YedYZ molybdopterin-dependent catalytic subunit